MNRESDEPEPWGLNPHGRRAMSKPRAGLFKQLLRTIPARDLPVPSKGRAMAEKFRALNREPAVQRQFIDLMKRHRRVIAAGGPPSSRLLSDVRRFLRAVRLPERALPDIPYEDGPDFAAASGVHHSP